MNRRGAEDAEGRGGGEMGFKLGLMLYFFIAFFKNG